LLGALASSKAVLAELLPFLAAVSKRVRRDDTNAISDIENSPFNNINTKINAISM
jgi:hypothetical protein